MSPAPGRAGPSQSPALGIELALIEGISPTPRVVFTPQTPPTRAMIGSGPSVDWPVRARGVDAQHAEIAWDGTTLWVRNAGSPSGTYIGIERVDDWRALSAGDEVGVGDARFAARPVGASGETRTPSPVQDLPGSGGDDYDDEATRVAAAVDNETTRIAPAPSAPKGGPPRPAAGMKSTMLGVAPPPSAGGTRPPAPAPAPRPASAASRPLPAPAPAPPPANRPLPRAPSTGGAPASGGGESTVITQNPYAEPDTAASNAPLPKASRGASPSNIPPPRFGGHPSVDRPDEATVAISHDGDGPMAIGSFSAASTISAENMAAMPALSAQGGFRPGPPPPAMAGPGAMAAQPSQPGAPNTFDAGASPGFAPAGQPGPGDNLSNMFGVIPPVAAPASQPAGQPVLTLPRRTQIMLGVTMIAGLIMLVMVLSRRDEPPPSAPDNGQSTASNTQSDRDPTPPLTAPTPAAPTGTLFAATIPPPAPPPDPRRRPDPRHTSVILPEGVTSVDPERVAASTVVNGRLREAIPMYEALAIAHPDSPVYRQIATILRRKVEAQETPCAPGTPNCGSPSSATSH